MQDFRKCLSRLSRPRLLVRAARLGMTEYRRERDLRRLIATVHPPAPEAALARLLDEEERIETTRQRGDAAYSLTRHVDLLIALMAEFRLLSQRAGA
ncbi:DUF6477 family protein [Szabonella alba]|uniref:Uncharacterized protein n=1 Tax=Szabonella alba TaxID=2804194 RepID=A0A8K0VCG3_9RHOB|nr:DUF6477 family protein [Szabonella alba]MBL4917204.1 hypothetical protein [Szabonella alba]